MTPETIGEVILALRLARGWSQGELARRAGLSRNNIALLESDTRKKNPQLSTLQTVFNALGVDIEIHLAKKKSEQLWPKVHTKEKKK